MRPRSPALLAALLIPVAFGCSAASRSDSVPAAAAALADADSLEQRQLAPGVHHVRAWLARGPWAVHVIEVVHARCTPAWEARKPAGSLDARAPTSALADDALATINADFFQLPGGTPVGAHVQAGTPLIGPGDRDVWLWDGLGMYAGPARLVGTLAAPHDSVQLVQLNRAASASSAYSPPRNGAALFTARAARVPPADSGADVVWLTATDGNEARGAGRVQRRDTLQTDTIAVPAGTAVLQLYGSARAWARRRAPGETVSWRAAVAAGAAGARDGRTAREAVGGFPLLLSQGRDVLDRTPTRPAFGTARHPRSAIGWNPDRVFLVLVDGRQAPYSDGMTLPELTWLFQRLGATHALNLDGGGSSALVVRGRVANRPSDREGERPVGNALALRACR